MSKKTYIKNCAHCGVVFEAAGPNGRYCSQSCKDATGGPNRKRTECPDTRRRYKEYQKAYRETNREAKNIKQRLSRSSDYAALKAEVKRWKPILDEVELKPDNLFLIHALVDELTSDSDLAWLLDWYWLSDAAEYLEQQGYEHE